MQQQAIDHAWQICKLFNRTFVNIVNRFSCTRRKRLNPLGEMTMATQRLAGSRIREKRLDRGLRQAAVAETVGISPSYLNLIEHNRRRIGGKLFADIARALGVEPARLVDGADADMLDQIRNAASQISVTLETDVELARADELATRYPGWAGLVAAQAERICALQHQVQALADRMSSDPLLAGSLHDVISAVSSIRSAASILVGPETLDDDWQRRFHENIHKDSLRLATSSEALIAYLEAPEADLDQAAPIAQVERYLAKTGFHIAALEGTQTDPATIVADSGLGASAQHVLLRWARQYKEDAQAIPLSELTTACIKFEYDPARIAQAMSAPFATVLRRLASLPNGAGHPPIGLAICDAAGVLTLLKPVPGFSLPHDGDACPLWPIYATFSRPLQPMRQAVSLPGASATPLLCYAIAEPLGAHDFETPPAQQSTMLVMPDPPQTGSRLAPVGVSCRICPRTHCKSRREPAMAGISGEAVF